MLREMYFGEVIPWERKNRNSEKQRELLRKMEAEERYFVEKMSLDDCQRFQEMLHLNTELAMSEDGEIFSYGFTMGALLIMDILEEAEAMKIE